MLALALGASLAFLAADVGVDLGAHIDIAGANLGGEPRVDNVVFALGPAASVRLHFEHFFFAAEAGADAGVGGAGLLGGGLNVVGPSAESYELGSSVFGSVVAGWRTKGGRFTWMVGGGPWVTRIAFFSVDTVGVATPVGAVVEGALAMDVVSHLRWETTLGFAGGVDVAAGFPVAARVFLRVGLTWTFDLEPTKKERPPTSAVIGTWS